MEAALQPGITERELPQIDDAGDGAERREMLDRFMGRAVFANADGIVREDVDGLDAAQRGQPPAARRGRS